MSHPQSLVRALLAIVVGAFAACRHPGGPLTSAHGGATRPAASAIAEPLVSIWLESDRPGARDFVLPQSGVTIGGEPAIGADGIQDVSAGAVEFGPALVLQLSAPAAARLNAALRQQPRRIVAMVNDRAIGVMRLAQLPADGKLAFLPELSEAELRATIAQLRPALARDRNRGFQR
jgi:hypothetical protein